MSAITERFASLSETWHKYRGGTRTRLLIGGAVLAFCIAVAIANPDAAPEALLTGAGGFLAALVHPMVLVGALTASALLLGWLDLSPRGRPRVTAGYALSVLAIVVMQIRNRRGLPHLWTIGVAWIGFLLIHPFVFFLLAVVPMAMIYANRRRVLRDQPSSVEPGEIPPDWQKPVKELESTAGLRYLTTLWFRYPNREDTMAAVFRLSDGLGLAVWLDHWMVTHQFGRKILFTTNSRWTVTLPGELGQLAASPDLDDVVSAQERVLAWLLQSGTQADRLSDEHAVAGLVRQFELDTAARRTAGPLTVLQAMVDEELNLRRDGGKGLLDTATGRRRLERWATA